MVVVAAVDQTDMAKTVVQEANELAAAFETPLHVVHARAEADITQAELEKVALDNRLDETRAVATAQTESLIRDLGIIADGVGLVGYPSEQIAAYASEHDARYIVVGSRSRSVADKALFGSVAQSIIEQAGCPVVSV